MEKAFGRFDKLSAAAYEAVKSGEYDTASGNYCCFIKRL